MQKTDVIVLGAGAAGLMCAIEAGARGRSVVVIDHAKKPAQKIRISGGGRCNFTNLHCSPANFIGENPRFCVSALKRFTQHDFIDLVDAHGISWHEKTLGQLFCDNSAQEIIDMLLDLARGSQARLMLDTKIEAISRDDDGFLLVTSKGPLRSESLVVATGGPSIPKMGATGLGYDIARQFNLRVVEPFPALVPLTFDQSFLAGSKELAGVSIDATVSCGKTQFREGLLFTHRGLSGPSILQISSYWRAGETIKVNLLPDSDLFELLRDLRQSNPRKEVAATLKELFPKRLGQFLVAQLNVGGRLADQSDKVLRAISTGIHAWPLKPVGSEGYRTAEVTRGGVDTNELSSKTMEAKAISGLFFIGEVVDITGHLGGFNFQWAWSSGHAAGQFV
ncbi:NAD(P)/FAD-dependent oxidoreductase [Polycladidibacter hongkongensis]|uniref:NAD(P)/FAD-dependent oxidoreductase n=1 Tax=Polycladidibacter hongkongensis TaxID=1647556 RepID=UPI000829ADFC|nr:NAD(P)/FAD-dependent oxidoreductase [Pseudovibrio hongkongensis]